MMRSPGLNPSSTPFFPGGTTTGKDEGGSGAPKPTVNRMDTDHASNTSSSLSISPSEFRSVRSSPSPPQEDANGGDRESPTMFRRSPTLSTEGSRGSPSIRAFDAGRNYPGLEMRNGREQSLAASLEYEGYSETEIPGLPIDSVFATGGTRQARESLFPAGVLASARERLATPPVSGDSEAFRSTIITNNLHAPKATSSPSSIDSAGLSSAAMDQFGFDAQLRASPLINDLVKRMIRYENNLVEIKRNLDEVNRKVDSLLDKSPATNHVPEFNDPFAPGNIATLNGSRPSLALAPHQLPSNPIPPNQVPPQNGSAHDEVGQISQRLNALTSSVGQLLALQTQQIQATSAGLPSASSLSGISPDVITTQPIGPSLSQHILGNGLPSTRSELRNSPRHPPQPMRTWSAGSLDLPPRGNVESSAAAATTRQETLLRDKRRSTVALLRRDSAGADSLAGANGRDNGPAVTKWDQLAVHPELLRSLVRFGVGPPNKIQQRALPFLLRGADIIAQAPPTQERIAAYVIPAIHISLTVPMSRIPRGPLVVIISTTVDQATQAQRMIRDLGGPIGVRSALGVGAASSASDIAQELNNLRQNMPHIICGTPQKLHALFTSSGGISGSEVRFLVLDEVDQLIARNLHDFVFNIVKLLPQPRSRPLGNGPSNGSTSSLIQALDSNGSLPRRFSTIGEAPDPSSSASNAVERQSALFSNTVPQDVLNLATAIQLREPVRVLVRRDGNVQPESGQSARGLRQYYLYLAFTSGGRSDAPSPTSGLGIIGSGRGASSAETAQAREWKLDALTDVFGDIEVPQAIVHVGGMTALDAVVYKLASKGLEPIPLHGDMSSSSKISALNKFRSVATNALRSTPAKVLVVYDVQVKTPEVSQVPLVVNYDLPKAVEEYAHRVAPAIASSYTRAGVVINFVTATGGDVEMLRSIECFYKIKCPEVPMSLRDII